jgi:glycosyltransferase involved in cell wall biosynthesis
MSIMSKVLFVVTQSEMGGAQRYIYEIAKGLAEKHDILVAAGRGNGEFFEKLKTARVRTLTLKHMKRAPWPWQIARAVWEIRELLKKEKPDVLFLCSTTAGLLGSVAGRLLKIENLKLKIVYRIGGWAFRDPRSFWKNWLILMAEKLTAPLKDLIVVNSEIDRELALKYKIAPPERIIKIYNGIDSNSLKFLPPEPKKEKIVGCVANFYKTKGLEYLIEAARVINAQFKIIGDGKLRPQLEGLIKKYHLENKVFLAGRIPDAYKYLKAFDVFVLPSLKEGFPWIILEAIAAEIPIVATNVGAVPEILPKEFLVNPGDAQALAKKISWMLEHPAITKLRPEFTWQKMVSETEKLLN